MLNIQNTPIFYKQIKTTPTKGLPTLIFLHEGLGCTALWKDFPETLCRATGLKGLSYDRQGYGRSGPMITPRGKDYLHVEALEYLPAILKNLQIKRPLLVGHSDGGTIALLYAAHFPHTVAVITEAAHVLVEDITLRGIEKALHLMDAAGIREKLRKYHGDKTDTLIDAWTDTWLSDWFKDWNIEDVLPRIQCPTLLIQGSDDEFATPQHLETIARRIGDNAHPLLLENCGHTPHRQSSERVLKEVTAFIEKVVQTE